MVVIENEETVPDHVLFGLIDDMIFDLYISSN